MTTKPLMNFAFAPGHSLTDIASVGVGKNSDRLIGELLKYRAPSGTFASQTVGVKQTDDRIWLVRFMHYDLGYFDDETCRLEPLQSPFGPKVLPMSPV